MKLIGNSVSVPVIEMICNSILETGFLNLNTANKENLLKNSSKTQLQSSSQSDYAV